MTMTDETINEAIYNIRNQMLMDYCERRIGKVQQPRNSMQN